MNRRSPSASTDRFFSAAAFLAAFALVSLFATGPALAATRLAYQDFESEGWQSQFIDQSVWEDHITRTTHDPYAGSYCLRWNQNEYRVDPITGLQGIGNSTLYWAGGTDIVSQTPNGVFFRMAFRHDDYNNSREWGGPRKLGYIVDDYYANNMRSALVKMRETLDEGSKWKKWDGWTKCENFRVYTPPPSIEQIDKIIKHYSKRIR